MSSLSSQDQIIIGILAGLLVGGIIFLCVCSPKVASTSDDTAYEEVEMHDTPKSSPRKGGGASAPLRRGDY
jgi:hypothetical protein